MAKLLRKIGILGVMGGVVLLWMGCTGPATSQRRYDTRESQDGITLFYDRASYVDLPGGKTSYGRECDGPNYEGPSDAGEPHWLCGGYLCLNGYCRSCLSNADCKAFFGGGQCSVVNGPNMMPGAVCWPMAAAAAAYASVQTDPRDVCVANPADAPEQHRLAAGAPCRQDCECVSSFCDRDTCADISSSFSSPAANYGRGPCKQGPSIELRIDADFCGGYVCVEQRCRSCTSDAECHDISPGSRCLAFPGLPGKQCEDADEHHLRQGPPRPLPKHKKDPRLIVPRGAPRAAN